MPTLSQAFLLGKDKARVATGKIWFTVGTRIPRKLEHVFGGLAQRMLRCSRR